MRERTSSFLTISLLLLGGFLPLCNRAAEIPGLFYAWGVANEITTNSAAAIGPITQISVGGFHGLALRMDGTVVSWGNNTHGQITNQPPGLSNVVAISAGAQHSVALRNDGTVVAWGRHALGQTNVPPTLNDAMAIAAGADHSVALRSNGTVVAWGTASLTSVPATATNVTAIAAGSSGTIALRADGTVIAWGTAINGLTNLPAGLTNVMAISASFTHALALRSNGVVVGWGDNAFGQSTTPLQLTNAVAISAGWLHSLAKRSDGTFLGWGLSTSGQAANPTNAANLTDFDAGNQINLAVDLAPRFVTVPPTNITLPPSANYTINATVLSGSEYTMQWWFNGTPLVGETNASLTVTNFTFSRAGAYALVVTNLVRSASLSTTLRLSNAPSVLVNGASIGGGPVVRTNAATITLLATTNAYPRLHYTLDGSTPDFTSPQYAAPFVVSNSVTLRAVAYNTLVTDKAEAATVNVQVIPTYSLLVQAPGGTVTRMPAADLSTNSYLSNTVVTLTATPSEGWVFMHWTGAASGTNAETSVVMNQSNFVQAVFGTTLNLNTNYSQGSVETDPIATPFPYGSVVTLTARPDPGSYFFGWAGLLTSFNNPVTLTVTNASGLTALFASLNSNQVSLVALPVNGGSIQANPALNVYTNDAVVTLTAWNTSNRVFSHWSGDASGTTNPLPLTMNGSKLVYANFVPGVPVSQLPIFTEIPRGSSLSLGNNAALSALTTGIGPIRYQWRLNSTVIAGATNPQLLVTNLTLARVGLYDVLASNAFGIVTSPAAPVAIFQLEFAPSVFGPLPLLVIDCAPGATFSLQHASDLRLTNWNLLAPLTTPAARSYFVDFAATNAQRFYRLVPQ